MKKSEILRRCNMWWLRYVKSLSSSNVHRMNVLYFNFLYWRRRYDFHFCNYSNL